MNLKQRIFANTSYQFIGQAGQAILSLASTYYLTRYLGKAGYGEYSVIITYVIFFIAFTDWGVNLIAVREISKKKFIADEILANVIGIKLIISGAAFLMAVVVANFMGYPSLVRKGIWLYSLILLLYPFQSIDVIFQAYLRTEFSILSALAKNVVLLTLIILITKSGQSILFILSAAVLSGALASVLRVIFSRRYVRLGLRFNLEVWKRLLRESIPLGLGSFCNTVTDRSGVILLSKLKGMAEVGIYSAPFRVIYFLSFIPSALMTSAFPLMSEYYSHDKRKFTIILQKSINYLFIIALPMALGGTLLANELVRFCFGSEFSTSVPVFRTLLWQLFTIYLGTVPAHALVSAGFQSLNSWINFAAMLLSVGLNLILISLYGAIGAAITMLVVFVFIATTKSLIATVKFGIPIANVNILKAIVSSLLFFPIVTLLKGIPFALIIIALAVIYICSMLLLRGIDMKDLDFLRHKL